MVLRSTGESTECLLNDVMLSCVLINITLSDK